MYHWWLGEQKNRKRVPHELEFFHAEIPAELAQPLAKAKQIAAQEVTPMKT